MASIGTEGLVGNEVVNIMPAGETGSFAREGDILLSKKGVGTDEMLQKLQKTNDDIATIAADLKQVVKRVNNSSALWDLLNEKSIPSNVRSSIFNIKLATVRQ